MIQSPTVKILDKIEITTIPKFKGEGCTPYIEVLSGRDFDLIYTNKNSANLKKHMNTEGGGSTHQHPKIVINVDKDPLLCGDIYFRLMHRTSSGKGKLICRFALNTSFIPQDEKMYEFTRNTVDPDAVQKDQRIHPAFKIRLYFKDVCTKCEPTMSLEQLCRRCVELMGDEVKTWKIIKNILDVRSCHFLLFRVTPRGHRRMACA